MSFVACDIAAGAADRASLGHLGSYVCLCAIPAACSYDRLYRKPVSKVLQVHAPFIDALYEYLTKRFANTATAAGMADFTSTNVTQRGKAIARRLPMRAWIDMINEAKLVDSVRVLGARDRPRSLLWRGTMLTLL